jgi:mono/diheme cytochrome c family protein
MRGWIGCITAISAALLVTKLLPAPRETAQNPDNTRLIASLDGPALYNAYCAVCHGTDAKGRGPMAASLKKRPPDLTRIAARNRGTYPAMRVERIISSQELILDGHGTREMPVWGPIFSQVTWDYDLGKIRVHNLAKYIEGLQKK